MIHTPGENNGISASKAPAQPRIRTLGHWGAISAGIAGALISLAKISELASGNYAGFCEDLSDQSEDRREATVSKITTGVDRSICDPKVLMKKLVSEANLVRCDETPQGATLRAEQERFKKAVEQACARSSRSSQPDVLPSSTVPQLLPSTPPKIIDFGDEPTPAPIPAPTSTPTSIPSPKPTGTLL